MSTYPLQVQVGDPVLIVDPRLSTAGQIGTISAAGLTLVIVTVKSEVYVLNWSLIKPIRLDPNIKVRLIRKEGR